MGIHTAELQLSNVFADCERRRVPATSPLTNEPMPNKSLRENRALYPFIIKARQQNEANVTTFIGTATASATAGAVKPNSTSNEISLSSDVFKELDRVMDLSQIHDLKLSPAQIVAIGMESSGKSTLLERIIGLPIFPKDKSRCTTCTIRVQLRRAAAELATLSIRDVSTKAESATICVALEKLCEGVRRLMRNIASRDRDEIISTKFEIMVKIQLPFVPNLDIIDLPGLVAATIEKSAQDLAKATYDLADRVIKRERGNSIYLLVVDVRNQVNHSRGSELVRINGIESQTIGVFTKADAFATEDDDNETSVLQDKLRQREVLSTHGWLLCASRPPAKGSYQRDIDRLAAMEADEERRLQCMDGGIHLQSGRAGMPVIRTALQDLFEDFLCHSWIPQINATLTIAMRKNMAQLAAFGLPILHRPDDSAMNHLIEQTTAVLAQNDDGFDPRILSAFDARKLQTIISNKVKSVTTGMSIPILEYPTVWNAICAYEAFIAKHDKLWARHSTNVITLVRADLAASKRSLTGKKKVEPAAVDAYGRQIGAFGYSAAPVVDPKTVFSRSSFLKLQSEPFAYTAQIERQSVSLLNNLITALKDVIKSEPIVDFLKSETLTSPTAENILKEANASKSVEDDDNDSEEDAKQHSEPEKQVIMVEDVQTGYYFNMQRYPKVGPYVQQQLERKLTEASDAIGQSLTAVLDNFVKQPRNFISSLHTMYGQDAASAKHTNLLRWTEEGREFAHILLDSFGKVSSTILPTVLSSFEAVPLTMLKREGNEEGRINILSALKQAGEVKAFLTRIQQSKRPLAFRSRPVAVVAPPPPRLQTFDKVAYAGYSNRPLGKIPAAWYCIEVTQAGVAKANGLYCIDNIQNTDMSCVMYRKVDSQYRQHMAQGRTFYGMQYPLIESFDGAPRMNFVIYRCQLRTGGYHWFLTAVADQQHPLPNSVDLYYALDVPVGIFHPPSKWECIEGSSKSIETAPHLKKLKQNPNRATMEEEEDDDDDEYY